MSKELSKIVDEVQDELKDSIVPESGANFDGGDQLRYLQELAKQDPSILEMDEYKSIIESVEWQNKSTQSQKQVVENNDVEEEVDDEEDEFEEEEVDDNPFFANKAKSKVKEIVIDFDIPEGMNDVLKKNFGVNDVETFFNSAQTWRNQAQEGVEYKKLNDQLSDELNSLPYELKVAIQAYANGDDPVATLKNFTRLNYDLDFEKQNQENLVQHYLPEEYQKLMKKFNNDEITEEDLDDRLALLAGTTKRLYQSDKKAVQDERDNYAQRAKDDVKKFKDSALISVDSFSKSFPDFSRGELSKIRSILIEDRVSDLFYNADGSYKEDASKLIAFALYGEKILAKVEKRGVLRGKSEEAQSIVDKSPKTLKRQKDVSVNKNQNIDSVKHLDFAFRKDPYS